MSVSDIFNVIWQIILQERMLMHFRKNKKKVSRQKVDICYVTYRFFSRVWIPGESSAAVVRTPSQLLRSAGKVHMRTASLSAPGRARRGAYSGRPCGVWRWNCTSVLPTTIIFTPDHVCRHKFNHLFYYFSVKYFLISFPNLILSRYELYIKWFHFKSFVCN